MKKTFIWAVLTVMAGALFAQAAGEKIKAAPVLTAQAAPKQTAAPAKKPEPAKPVEDQEESVVMIDDRTDSDYTRVSSAEEQPAGPGGIPSSYGQCKGVMNDGGRTVLVFESADDGSISFVQVTLGKTGAAWKLVDRIYRSAE